MANRHLGCLVKDNISGHQNRVTEKAESGKILSSQIFLHLLVSRIPLKPGNRGNHREDQIQLGMLWDMALAEDRALLRVDTKGNPVQDHIPDTLPDAGGVGVFSGKRVPVGGKEETFIISLQLK